MRQVATKLFAMCFVSPILSLPLVIANRDSESSFPAAMIEQILCRKVDTDPLVVLHRWCADLVAAICLITALTSYSRLLE